MTKKIIPVLLLVFFSAASFAQQTKEDIQRKQQQLQRELADLNNTLSDIKKNKKQSLSQLALVQRKIKAREELVGNINKELHKIDDDIYLNSLDIYRYKKELDTLKLRYAKNLVFAYKNRSNYDYLNFVFSAENFNDAIKRISYLKSYRQYREAQANNITKTQNLLQTKMNSLNTTKTQKNTTLQEQGKQIQQMELDKKEKDDVVKGLQGQEKDLSAQIKDREVARKKLQGQLKAIINREIAEARRKEEEKRAQLAKLEEERKKKLAAQQTPTGSNKPDNTTTANNNTTTVSASVAPATTTRNPNRTYSPLESTPENLTASVNFENNRGRLPWPVSSGTILIPYGKYNIPGTKLVDNNDGIDIGVPTGTTVKAVADGVVSAVVDLGDENMVVVRHGKYFTTYSHLSTVSVTKNNVVQAGTIVGKAAANDDGGGMVHFLVSNEQGNFLNPESWLKGR